VHKEKCEVKVEGKGEEEDEEKERFWNPEPENRALQDKTLQCVEKKLAGQTSLRSIRNDSVRLQVNLWLRFPSVAVVFA